MAVGLGSTFEEVIKKINSCGDVTAAGDNTFTGSNVFKKAVTLYTDAVNGNSMSATLDSYKLKLLNDLGGVYADLNITDDTAPYLELKTVGYGKVKYTSESIIFTDTQGNSKTTTLKFPGQGATADSIQTLATLKDLDKKQPLLVSGTNVKTINGQSILGSGNLEISGGGTGGSDGIYVHVISFDFTESLNGSTCKGVITITNSSNDNFIVDTNISSNSLTNLTNFLSNINNSFYPLATTNTAGSNLPYIGISYNSDSSEYVVYLSDTSSQTAPVSITIDDTTFVETVIQTSTGGGGGSPDSNAPVLISISSVKNITSEAHINVRVISGTLQAGDRIELCKPIKKTAYNRINGVKTNIRKRHRLKTVVFSTITENDIQNYKNGKNIFTILLQTSGSNEKITSIDHSYTYDSSPLKSPLTVRIVRQTKLLNSTQNIQISNSVYLTLNYYSQVLKPM